LGRRLSFTKAAPAGKSYARPAPLPVTNNSTKKAFSIRSEIQTAKPPAMSKPGGFAFVPNPCRAVPHGIGGLPDRQ